MDEYNLGRHIGDLEARVKALEEKAKHGGGCGCGTGASKPDGTVEYKGIAEIVDDPADPTIITKVAGLQADHEKHFMDGQTRAQWVNGVCYCQMLCGNQWVYFCYPNGYCILCPGGITVSCGGVNRQLKC